VITVTSVNIVTTVFHYHVGHHVGSITVINIVIITVIITITTAVSTLALSPMPRQLALTPGNTGKYITAICHHTEKNDIFSVRESGLKLGFEDP
jgi:hypothetical protein